MSSSPPPLLTETFPFTWSEQINQRNTTQPPSTPSEKSSASQQRLHDGTFGEMHSVPLQTYRTRPQHDTFRLEHATVFTNMAYEWKERLEALKRANKALEQQREMATQVQRELTVQLLHQLRRKWMVSPQEAEGEAAMTLVEQVKRRMKALEHANSEEE